MKIKHYAGYGTVNATKTVCEKVRDIYGEFSLTKIVIRVQGNHERGIIVNDIYDAFYWLLKKHFAKNLVNDSCVERLKVSSFIQKTPNGEYEDVCDYTFIIRNRLG